MFAKLIKFNGTYVQNGVMLQVLFGLIAVIHNKRAYYISKSTLFYVLNVTFVEFLYKN